MEGTVGVYQQLQAVGVKASMSLISTSDLDLMSEMIGLCGRFQSKENLRGLFHLLYCCHIFLPLGTKNQSWLIILLMNLQLSACSIQLDDALCHLPRHATYSHYSI